MKKVVLLGLLPLFINSNTNVPIEVCYEETIIELKPKSIQPIITDGDLLTALIFVESRGNDSAIGDRHLVGNEAVGALQIRPIMVREVNRICKLIGSHQRFTLKDRFDREKSIHMFRIWKEFHHKDSSPEKVARNWNGGPKGYKKDRTIKYWNKIEKQLNNE
jgi:hypothetical protein